MSIELQFKKGSLALRVILKDEALTALQKIVFEYQSDEVPVFSAESISIPPAQLTPILPVNNGDSTTASKAWLSKHSASEALNLIGWDTNPEKILILGAFFESRGGAEGWRSADMQDKFSEARDSFPKNFPRDVSAAIKDNLIATVTARSYKVSRTGWNKIAEAVASLGHA
jgi:hypothetical protein